MGAYHEVIVDGVVYVPKDVQSKPKDGWENVSKRKSMVHFEKVSLRKIEVRDSFCVRTLDGYSDDGCRTPLYGRVGAAGQYVLLVPCPTETTAYAFKEMIEGVCKSAREDVAEKAK